MTAIRKYLWLIIGVALIFVLLNVFPAPARADLPPRPTPTAVPNTALVGANIVLQTQSGAWSVVQWQDVNGDWHDVDGWRGTVVDGTVTWWVAQKDFDSGPFRWVVYQSEDGAITGVSGVFHLPGNANETATITVP